MTAEEAAELERARERMLARHKLIEGMIRNNEMQLKNESARGGAEIELECARRDVARASAGPDAQAELERATARLQALAGGASASRRRARMAECFVAGI